MVEPRAMTLSDLFALVFGCALAFSLLSYQSDLDIYLLCTVAQGDVRHSSMPVWLARVVLAQESVMRVGIALMPVILARRCRFGGICRPLEALAIFCGLLWVENSLTRSGWLPSDFHWDNWSGSTADVILRVPTGPLGQLWRWGNLAAFIVSTAALLLFRRKLPGVFRTLLLAVAALGWLSGVGPLFYEGLYKLLQHPVVFPSYVEHTSGSIVPAHVGLQSRVLFDLDYDGFLYRKLGTLPIYLLFCVPVVAEWRAWRRDGRPSWTWVEWVALAFSCVLFLQIQTGSEFFDACFCFCPAFERAIQITVLLLALATACLLSGAIITCFAPGWGRRPTSSLVPRPLTTTPMTVLADAR